MGESCALMQPWYIRMKSERFGFKTLQYKGKRCVYNLALSKHVKKLLLGKLETLFFTKNAENWLGFSPNRGIWIHY